ncbi:MAG: T9SS C-terminal target domain-containing protein [Calditrichaeota bacterium]|nr:MAG: T9SS C-terminal target domain-containing protein [Calditrichota bacterium]
MEAVLRWFNVITGIDEPITSHQPQTYQLMQNYPNPFNPGTTIAFYLPAPSEVTLTVYDITGQKVRTLFQGQASPGEHQIYWDGKNEAGETVSSGVYVYQLNANQTFQAVRKMILMK